MPTVKNRTYTRPQPTKPWLSRAFALLVFLATLTTSGAAIFGISTARLRFDIVSVRNQPTDIDTLDLVIVGDTLPVSVIASTASIPKDGLSVRPSIDSLIVIVQEVPMTQIFVLQYTMSPEFLIRLGSSVRYGICLPT